CSATSLYLHHLSFSFYCSDDHRDLHSFPTRRSSDLQDYYGDGGRDHIRRDINDIRGDQMRLRDLQRRRDYLAARRDWRGVRRIEDRKSTRLNSSHDQISYAVFCLKKKYRALALVLNL